MHTKTGLLAALLPAALGTFIHPGILHTEDDLNRMRKMVNAKTEPWYSAWLNMTADSHASLKYNVKPALSYATRNSTGSSPGKTQISSDSVAAVLNALSFYITQDTRYAEKAVQILDGWSGKLQLLNGTDAQLTSGLYGPQFVNAAEILRSYYPAWNMTMQDRFSDMILNVFYPPASDTKPNKFFANWGSAAEKAIVAFGVWLNNQTMYDEGLQLYEDFNCSNLAGTINSFGQNSESGRDQGHTMLGLANMAELCQTAQSQGDNRYWDLLSDRLMVGYEYTARYNLGNSVPYDPAFYRCGANLVGGPWQNISATDRGAIRPVWEIAFGYYNGVSGRDMPYTQQVLELQGLETNNTVNNVGDQAVYGTLRFRRTVV